MPEELLEKAVAGDADALTSLLRTYGPQVRRRLSISPTWRASLDLADVMQVTYLEAFLRIRQLRSRTLDGFVAWITQIAKCNLSGAIRELKRAKRPDPRRRVQARTPDESWTSLLATVTATTSTASRKVAAAEAQTLMAAAIKQLPQTYRQVIELFDLAGRSVHEVAQTLGRSPGAVYMLRARAVDRLREILGSRSRYF